MPASISAQVLVVGAGPVGLTLALDLAWRGIDVLVVETRERGEPPSVKCNHVSARTMEIFRRLGVAQAVRNANALPADYPNDVGFRATTTGVEFARIHIPCRRDRYTDQSGPDGWWPTPEPPHRINQIYLEPVLFAHAAGRPGIRILNRTKLIGFEQSDQAVLVSVQDLESGAESTVACGYMVACDGAHSETRRAIGARLAGDAVVQRTQSTFIRAPDLIRRMRASPAWSTQSLNPRRSGNIFAIDGRETWLIHNYLRADETHFDAVDRDRCIRLILGVGPEFDYKVIGKEDWIGRRMVADRFGNGRVFICGDAAHIWVPFAGYGMNAGIADAMNLSWKLAGVLAGWADPAILEAYETERQPITEQVSHYAMDTAIALARARGEVPTEIETPGAAGDAVRAEFGRKVYALNVPQYCCAGLNFGYFYEGSPIIAYDGEDAPPYTMDTFEPSTAPGCRTPHFWMPDGRSLYDALGAGFTLLRFDRAADVDPLMRAAASRGLSLTLLDVADGAAPAPYNGLRLLLSRPDQHVGWRGIAPPRHPGAVVDKLRVPAHSALWPKAGRHITLRQHTGRP
jgi:2-polyprenyl-6-methoxyphenol hydroxylase-like FAD-dependent oxidoreductase